MRVKLLYKRLNCIIVWFTVLNYFDRFATLNENSMSKRRGSPNDDGQITRRLADLLPPPIYSYSKDSLLFYLLTTLSQTQ